VREDVRERDNRKSERHRPEVRMLIALADTGPLNGPRHLSDRREVRTRGRIRGTCWNSAIEYCLVRSAGRHNRGHLNVLLRRKLAILGARLLDSLPSGNDRRGQLYARLDQSGNEGRAHQLVAAMSAFRT
jgi:hypothetical protein